MNTDPIITTLLDTDIYKFYMGAFIKEHYPNVEAEYTFVNRDPNIRLDIDLKELAAELDHVRTLKIADGEEKELLKLLPPSQGLKPYIAELWDLHLPEYDLVPVNGGGLNLRFRGPWHLASLWETYAMSIVSELYQRKQADSRNERISQLEKKTCVLSVLPHIKIVDFGTRRRFSKEWHDAVIERLLIEGENLVGTSNVALAMKYCLPCIGTMGHELFMGVAALYDHAESSLRGSQQTVLRQWWNTFGEPLSIALSDTWSSNFFFGDVTDEQLQLWRGLRQDSGDPMQFAKRARETYIGAKVDSTNKTLVFSDGLDLQKILVLDALYGKWFQCRFGWGTDLVNDTGRPVPPIVVKLSRVYAGGGGAPSDVVKLSDTPGKYMGSASKLPYYQKAFNDRSSEAMDRFAAPHPTAPPNGYRM